jgi:hypothetical protein
VIHMILNWKLKSRSFRSRCQSVRPPYTSRLKQAKSDLMKYKKFLNIYAPKPLSQTFSERSTRWVDPSTLTIRTAKEE